MSAQPEASRQAPAAAGAAEHSRAELAAFEAERAQLGADADYQAWLARQKSPAEVSVRPTTRAREQIERMGAAALSRSQDQSPVASTAASCNTIGVGSACGVPSSGQPVSGPRPPAIAAGSELGTPTADPRRRLSRREWLKRELAAEQLAARIERRRAAKTDKRRELPDNALLWSEGRERRYVEARAKVRPLIDGRASAAADRWRELARDPITAHYAIGIKRLCDARGWTLGDLPARRALALLEFLRELATPNCWNARYARRPRRGMGTFGDVLARAGRKYAPCVRAIAQPALASVLAWPGDGPDDDRSVHRKTVGRVAAGLEEVGLVQAVQVPQHAADAIEVGASGHVINRYWLADRGSPKPALLGCWNPAGELLWLDILASPWRGATPRAPDPSGTPPP